MIIKNGKVFHEDGTFKTGDVAVSGELFADLNETGLSGSDVLDAAGCYVIPGLIDIHFHGCAGYDFSGANAKELVTMARFLAKNGTTAICPATLTLPEDQLAEACRRIAALSDPEGAAVVGIHLEGPFFSHNKRGAQNPDHLQLPNIDMVRRLQKEAGGSIKLVAVAPELDGAMSFIEELSKEIRCSVAHTEANYETALEAFKRGARQVTHLYNAMPPLLHREPGVIGAARDFPECSAELICDGVHVHPSAVRAAFAMFGENRIIMISDSVMATGKADGIWDLGGLEIEVTGRCASLVSTKTLAGSICTLMDCLRIAVTEMDIPLTSAVKCCTMNPAKSIGIFDRYGSISPGKYADFVLLNEDLTVRGVYLRGTAL